MSTAAPDGATFRDLSDHRRHIAPHIFVYVFAAVPALALVAAVPLAWGWGLSCSTPDWPRACT